MDKSINLQEVKKIELSILKQVDCFCKNNELSYFLDSGTLIGAVRHKGFIPWDDDIDISMPRKDYEIFIKTFNDCDSKYRVLTIDNNSEYVYPFAKVVDKTTELTEKGVYNITDMGVYIDVFPIDGLPKNYLLRRFHQYNCFFWRLIAVFDVEKASNLTKFRYKILKILSGFIGYRKALKRCDKLLKKYDMNDTLYAYPIVYNQTSDLKIESIAFNERVQLEFEGELFYAPARYDDLLRVQYGDYLKLPPKDEQINKHEFVAVYR